MGAPPEEAAGAAEAEADEEDGAEAEEPQAAREAVMARASAAVKIFLYVLFIIKSPFHFSHGADLIGPQKRQKKFSPFRHRLPYRFIGLILSGQQKKPRPNLLLGQDFHPAVPPKLTRKAPARFRGQPSSAALVTGAAPVSCYLPYGFRLPSQVHSPESSLPRSHHPRLSERLPARLLLLLKGFIFDCFAL